MALGLQSRWVNLHSDSATAVAIFQVGKGQDAFIQACAWQIWLKCAIHEVTLAFSHIPGESLTSTTDALSRWHMGTLYKDELKQLVDKHGVQIVSAHDDLFILSSDL